MKSMARGIAALMILIAALSGAGCREKAAQDRIEIKIAMLNPPKTLNPITANDSSSQEISDLLYRGLVDWNEKWELFPVIAREVPSYANGGIVRAGQNSLKIDYFISPVARWSNGVYITSGDFLFFYELAKYPGLVNAGDEWLKKADKVASYNGDTVEMIYRGLNPQFLSCLKPLPRFFLEGPAYKNARSFFLEPVKWQSIVSGPYMISESVLKQEKITSLKLVRNPEYNIRKPGLSGFMIKFFLTSDAFESDVFAGNYDVIPYLSFEQGEKISHNDAYNVYYTAGTSLDAVFFDTSSRILSDVRLRKALCRALDRKGIVKALYGDKCHAAESWMSERHGGYAPVFESMEYDQKAAFDLLKDSGWSRQGEKGWQKGGKSFDITLFYMDRPDFHKVAGLLKENWERSGISVKEEKVVRSRFWEVLAQKEKAGAYPDVILATLDIPPLKGPDELFSRTEIPSSSCRGGGANYGRWISEENEKLCSAVYQERDKAAREALMKKQQELVARDVPMAPLYFRPHVGAAKKNIRNFSPRGFGSVMWNIEEWQLDSKGEKK